MNKCCYFVLIFLLSAIVLTAQVTIGEGLSPKKGALLDLKMNDSIGVNSTKGLLLPRVALENIRIETDLGKTMGAKVGSTLDATLHIGLVVFNTNSNTDSEETRFCPGVHVWDGKLWQPINPYPEVRILEVQMDYYKRGYIYLDPGNPEGWPEEKQEARAAGKYNLGRNATLSPSPNGTDNISDARVGEVNTYTVSRFYVGYKTVERKYRIKKSFSCNESAVVNWDLIPEEPTIYTRLEKTFDDGVWMTQNLRTKKLPDGTDLVRFTPEKYGDASTHIPMYTIPGITSGNEPVLNENEGLLYNWSAAVAVGKVGGLATFPATNPKINQGSGSHPDIIYKGICPTGWNLPSNQEWTDLANGIVEKTSLFSDVLSGAATKILYGVNLSSGTTVGEGGSLGQAMKTTSAVSGKPSGGKSKTSALGGFDAYMVGSSTVAENGLEHFYLYGDDTFFWSGSLHGNSSTTYPNRVYVYHTWLKNSTTTQGNGNFYQGFHNTLQTFSVRCKKTTN